MHGPDCTTWLLAVQLPVENDPQRPWGVPNEAKVIWTILPFGHCRLRFTPASAVSQTEVLDASHKDGVARTDAAGGRSELSDHEFRVRKPGNEAHVLGL